MIPKSMFYMLGLVQDSDYAKSRMLWMVRLYANYFNTKHILTGRYPERQETLKILSTVQAGSTVHDYFAWRVRSM